MTVKEVLRVLRKFPSDAEIAIKIDGVKQSFSVDDISLIDHESIQIISFERISE